MCHQASTIPLGPSTCKHPPRQGLASVFSVPCLISFFQGKSDFKLHCPPWCWAGEHRAASSHGSKRSLLPAAPPYSTTGKTGTEPWRGGAGGQGGDAREAQGRPGSTYQAGQHFLKAAVQKLAHDLGQHAGQREHVSQHSPRHGAVTTYYRLNRKQSSAKEACLGWIRPKHGSCPIKGIFPFYKSFLMHSIFWL